MDSATQTTYYTIEKHLLRLYEQNSRKMGFNAQNPQEHVAWKDKVRASLTALAGITKMKTADLQPQELETKQGPGFTRKKIILQTEPGVWMPVYVLLPEDWRAGEARPCLIAPHGHGSGGKAGVAGKMDLPGVKEGWERYRGDYGVQLVKEGYIVFCPDARGSGERREAPTQGNEREKILASSCNDLNNIAISLGQSLIGMWTWDLMRLLDYIETCSFCASGAIGCCGLSGGGWQTLWLAALDERVKCAIISGYFHGFKGTILRTNKCGCNYLPHLWEYVEVGDLGALIAPRPLLIESGAQDPLNGERGLDDVAEQLAITRSAYRLYGQEDQLWHHVFPGGHGWNGAKLPEFAAKYLPLVD